MFESGRKLKSLITTIGGVICFVVGFTTSTSIQETNWLGHLVHGVYSEPELSIVPVPDEFLPEVDDDIIIVFEKMVLLSGKKRIKKTNF